MKYAVVFLCVLGIGCMYLAYRLGYSNCRTDAADVEIQTVQNTIKTDTAIVQRVMSVSDLDNLDWLCGHHLRAD